MSKSESGRAVPHRRLPISSTQARVKMCLARTVGAIRQRQQGCNLQHCAGAVCQATIENLGTTACGAQVDVIVEKMVDVTRWIA
jgi:hypothetical protein